MWPLLLYQFYFNFIFFVHASHANFDFMFNIYRMFLTLKKIQMVKYITPSDSNHPIKNPLRKFPFHPPLNTIWKTLWGDVPLVIENLLFSPTRRIPPINTTIKGLHPTKKSFHVTTQYLILSCSHCCYIFFVHFK